MSTFNVTSDTYTKSSEDQGILALVYRSTIFYSFLLGASILIFFAFLLLSTRTQRRTCIFYLLSATFVMLMITAISALVKENQMRLNVFAKNLDKLQAAAKIRQRSAALVLMERTTCFMADMALICKLKSFYPIPAYSNRRRFLRVSPLLTLIPLRLAAIALLPAAIMQQRRDLGLQMNIGEYVLQILWCTFATGTLFYKSWRFFQRAASREDERLKRKLRILMESIICTFLVPICFQITCVIALIVYKDPTKGLFPIANAFNLFTSVHFALLSTTWSAIRERTEKASEKAIPAPTLVTSFFASQSTQSSIELQERPSK